MFNRFLDELKNRRSKVCEYINFNIIGIANFIVSQMFYIGLHLIVKINYISAYTLTTFLSITASYFLNTKITFKQQKYSTKRFSMSILVYLFEYVFNMGIIFLLVEFLGISKIISPFIAQSLSTIPVFFMMRSVLS
jgi:putative flippase GtrA